MVAISGPGWVLAPSLQAYVDEADRYFPGRDHASDGSIGDQSHASRASDHNPRGGFVHAVDLDEDLKPGLDLRLFAAYLRTSHDSRIAYVIYEGRIFKSWGTTPWKWQPYTGPNAHRLHLHLSILRTTAARQDQRAWGFKNLLPQEDDMTPEQSKKLDAVELRSIAFDQRLARLERGMAALIKKAGLPPVK